MREYADGRDGRFRTLLDVAVQHAVADNYWFTENNVRRAMRVAASKMLDEQILVSWMSKYPMPTRASRNIGLITAGNIPLVGFHDLLCVLISGDRATVKLSSKDTAMMRAVCEILVSEEPRFAESIRFVERIPDAPDAVLASGNDNSARYFEAAYDDIPRIVRKNRYSLAVLSGEESDEDLTRLGGDMFDYFGLGCRNVSCLLVPTDYKFDRLFEAIETYEDVMKHEGYANCYRYRKAVLDLSGTDYATNGFVLLLENAFPPASLASTNYVRCASIAEAERLIRSEKDKIQCVASNIRHRDIANVPFGATQSPEIYDYADGADTVEFLSNLR